MKGLKIHIPKENRVAVALFGIAAFLFVRSLYFGMTASPLQETKIQKPEDVTKDKIQRALDKLKNGDVLVNDTPEQTKGESA